MPRPTKANVSLANGLLIFALEEPLQGMGHERVWRKGNDNRQPSGFHTRKYMRGCLFQNRPTGYKVTENNLHPWRCSLRCLLCRRTKAWATYTISRRGAWLSKCWHSNVMPKSTASERNYRGSLAMRENLEWKNRMSLVGILSTPL